MRDHFNKSRHPFFTKSRLKSNNYYLTGYLKYRIFKNNVKSGKISQKWQSKKKIGKLLARYYIIIKTVILVFIYIILYYLATLPVILTK